MLPSLTVAFIVGLLIGSQIQYFPLSTSFLLLLAGLGAVALERFNRVSVRRCYVALRNTLSWSGLLGGGRQSDLPMTQ